MNQEIDKNKFQAELLSRKYAEQYQEALQNFEDKATSSLHQNVRERNLERNQYYDSIQETEYNANARIREQEAGHDREKESIYKQFTAVMDRQRREYENILEFLHPDPPRKLSNYRADSENAFKVAQREAKMRQNELVHDYEKKLTDQKREYEAQIENMKAQAQIDTREAERRIKSELEGQAKGYELRIAQLEAQIFPDN